MWLNLRYLGICSVLVLLAGSLSGQVVLQSYAEGKITLKKGFVIEGKNLRVSMDTATMDVLGSEQSYLLSEITQIMAKQGKGKRYGNYCAGSCAGFLIVSMITNPKATRLEEDGTQVEYTPSAKERITSLALSSALSYGIGYLIGRFSDDWQVVYFYNG
jgi:hypothetical protein